MSPDLLRDRTIKFIEECQNGDGGFGSTPSRPSEMESTCFAVDTLTLLDTQILNKAKIAEWTKSCLEKQGGFKPDPIGESDLTSICSSMITSCCYCLERTATRLCVQEQQNSS